MFLICLMYALYISTSNYVGLFLIFCVNLNKIICKMNRHNVNVLLAKFCEGYLLFSDNWRNIWCSPQVFNYSPQKVCFCLLIRVRWAIFAEFEKLEHTKLHKDLALTDIHLQSGTFLDCFLSVFEYFSL